MITHIEDAYEPCPECGSEVPLRRVDPPAPHYGRAGREREPLPSLEPQRCPSCGTTVPEEPDPSGGDPHG